MTVIFFSVYSRKQKSNASALPGCKIVLSTRFTLELITIASNQLQKSCYR